MREVPRWVERVWVLEDGGVVVDWVLLEADDGAGGDERPVVGYRRGGVVWCTDVCDGPHA